MPKKSSVHYQSIFEFPKLMYAKCNRMFIDKVIEYISHQNYIIIQIENII